MLSVSAIVRIALVLVLGAVTTTARAEDVRKAIEANNAALRTALLAGDAQKVTDLYTSTAEIIPAGGPIASGHPAILEFWKGFVASSPKDLALETRAVEVSGDIAVEDGTVKITGKDGSVSTSRYVVVWKKDRGTWKLNRDIWNEGK